MSGRALVLSLFVVAGCTSTQEPLAQIGEQCDYDQQCATPLVCRCEVIRGTGDDGNDEIVRHGRCEHQDYDPALCEPNDAATDTTPFDSHLPPTDGADETATDSNVDETAADSSVDETTTDSGVGETDLDAEAGGG